jgi:tungstate transport system substrate-binding protein
MIQTIIMLSKRTMNLTIVAIFAILLVAVLAGCTSPTPTVSPTAAPSATPTPAPQGTLKLATTSSLFDSGLLNAILPGFEQANNAKVNIVFHDTSGGAMNLARMGEADAVMVHDPAAEAIFVGNGTGWNNTQFAHNWYIVVGPANDPAGIKNITNATLALKKIYLANSTFVGRNDNSGTSTKEISTWKAAGLTMPTNLTQSWYKSSGAGMLVTLNMAAQLGAYTLTDKSTFLANEKNLAGLVLLVDATPDMINKYDVYAINNTRFPNVNYELAKKFIAYMISNETQAKINDYGMSTVGQKLFWGDQIML